MWKRVLIPVFVAVAGWAILLQAGGDQMGMNHAMDSAYVANTFAAWSGRPHEIADDMVAKYGQPDEITPTHAIWYNNGPWKMTTVHKAGAVHNWPHAHTDYLEQQINYKVAPDKFDDLAQFDGSVIVDRTRGTLTAFCDNEAMSFLAVNLANDVVTGGKMVADARANLETTARKVMDGGTDPYVQKFQFTVPAGGTGDADQMASTSNGKPGASVGAE